MSAVADFLPDFATAPVTETLTVKAAITRATMSFFTIIPSSSQFGQICRRRTRTADPGPHSSSEPNMPPGSVNLDAGAQRRAEPSKYRCASAQARLPTVEPTRRPAKSSAVMWMPP